MAASEKMPPPSLGMWLLGHGVRKASVLLTQTGLRFVRGQGVVGRQVGHSVHSSWQELPWVAAGCCILNGRLLEFRKSVPVDGNPIRARKECSQLRLELLMGSFVTEVSRWHVTGVRLHGPASAHAHCRVVIVRVAGCAWHHGAGPTCSKVSLCVCHGRRFWRLVIDTDAWPVPQALPVFSRPQRLSWAAAFIDAVHGCIIAHCLSGCLSF